MKSCFVSPLCSASAEATSGYPQDLRLILFAASPYPGWQSIPGCSSTYVASSVGMADNIPLGELVDEAVQSGDEERDRATQVVSTIYQVVYVTERTETTMNVAYTTFDSQWEK